jgi:hypothetical protein
VETPATAGESVHAVSPLLSNPLIGINCSRDYPLQVDPVFTPQAVCQVGLAAPFNSF